MYYSNVFWLNTDIRGFFSTAVREVFVAKLVILGISPLTSFILKLREALVPKLVTSDILSSILLILALYISFLMASFFTKLLSLLKSTEQVIIFQHLIYVLYFPKF